MQGGLPTRPGRAVRRRREGVGAGAAGAGGRRDFGSSSNGATADGRVGFCIDAESNTGSAKCKPRAENNDGRTFAVVLVETAVA
jgi:hypothetical protein